MSGILFGIITCLLAQAQPSASEWVEILASQSRAVWERQLVLVPGCDALRANVPPVLPLLRHPDVVVRRRTIALLELLASKMPIEGACWAPFEDEVLGPLDHLERDGFSPDMFKLLPHLLTDRPSELTVRRVMTAYLRSGADSFEWLLLLNRHAWAGKWLALQLPPSQVRQVADILITMVPPMTARVTHAFLAHSQESQRQPYVDRLKQEKSLRWMRYELIALAEKSVAGSDGERQGPLLAELRQGLDGPQPQAPGWLTVALVEVGARAYVELRSTSREMVTFWDGDVSYDWNVLVLDLAGKIVKRPEDYSRSGRRARVFPGETLRLPFEPANLVRELPPGAYRLSLGESQWLPSHTGKALEIRRDPRVLEVDKQ